MKKTVEGDTSLSFREIVFSPIFALWRMANGKERCGHRFGLRLEFLQINWKQY